MAHLAWDYRVYRSHNRAKSLYAHFEYPFRNFRVALLLHKVTYVSLRDLLYPPGHVAHVSPTSSATWHRHKTPRPPASTCHAHHRPHVTPTTVHVSRSSHW